MRKVCSGLWRGLGNGVGLPAHFFLAPSYHVGDLGNAGFQVGRVSQLPVVFEGEAQVAQGFTPVFFEHTAEAQPIISVGLFVVVAEGKRLFVEGNSLLVAT